VYSNTGGQASKSTPVGAAAKFAVAGKALPKKDLAMMAMAYGNVYVASVAFGSKDAQTVRALAEAASYDGPSLVLAYSHCIAHGYELSSALDQQKMAVATGYWPLFRYDPRKLGSETGPLTMDSSEPNKPLWDFMQKETRFRVVEHHDHEAFKRTIDEAEAAIRRRYAMLKRIAGAGEQAAAAVASAAE
jgi:pyruvate-ferredoxin/flavodoxin oxidoreductase